MIILALGLIGQLHAQDELPVGARPMGMSGAFIAVADDANTVMWNPAGITQMNQQELTAMWTNLYNSGAIQSHLGYVLPITNRLATGADWTSIQFKDGELEYRKDRVHFAGAYRPTDWLSGGCSIKVLFSSTKLDDISEGDTRRVDGDIGLLLRPLFFNENLDKVKLALVLRDVANTNVTHEYQSKISREEISARKGVVGLAYETPLPNLIISAETDLQLNERFSIGGEYQFGNLPVGVEAMLRAGLHRDWDTGERPSFALGGSLGVSVTKYSKILLEYAYLNAPMLPSTHHLAMRIPFDFYPTAVDILGCDSEMPLFASLYERYAKVPTIDVGLFNKQERPIKLQISLAVKGYTPEIDVTPPEYLTEKQEKAYPLTIVLSEEILGVQGREIPITIEVTYPEESRFKPAKKTFPISFYPKGNVPLIEGEGVKPYVAFITHEDEPVKEFSRMIVEQYDAPEEMGSILAPDKMAGVRGNLRNFFVAMQIYEALRGYGIYYRPDANEAYNKITKFSKVRAMEGQESEEEEEGYFVDSVRYPREFLLHDDLGGDCDDWSVLYASLLESQGIATALVDVPGHVFVMFNTGLPPHNDAVIGLTEERYIAWNDTIWDKTIWIPIDPPQRTTGTREIDDSFHAAWEHGLRQCQTHKIEENPARIVVVREVQIEYPYVSLGTEYGRLPNPPERAKVDLYLADALNLYHSEWEAYMVMEESSPRHLNENGIAAAHRGNFETAQQQFENALKQSSTLASAYNNLGNLYFSKGYFDKAIENYESAQRYAPDDEGIRLNLALAYLAKGEKEEANRLFSESHRKVGSNEVCRRLGIPHKEKGIKSGVSIMFVKKLYRILEQVEKKESLNVELSPEDVRGMSTGFYWKRQAKSEE